MSHQPRKYFVVVEYTSGIAGETSYVVFGSNGRRSVKQFGEALYDQLRSWQTKPVGVAWRRLVGWRTVAGAQRQLDKHTDRFGRKNYSVRLYVRTTGADGDKTLVPYTMGTVQITVHRREPDCSCSTSHGDAVHEGYIEVTDDCMSADRWPGGSWVADLTCADEADAYIAKLVSYYASRNYETNVVRRVS